MSKLHKIFCTLPVAVARSSSDNSVICYVLVVLWMFASTSWLIIPYGGKWTTLLRVLWRCYAYALFNACGDAADECICCHKGWWGQSCYLQLSRIKTANRQACIRAYRHWSFLLRADGPWETMRFQLRLPMPGTHCHLSSEINSHWQPFDNNWRQYFSGHPLARMPMPEPRHC